jgi:hypothetical protein
LSIILLETINLSALAQMLTIKLEVHPFPIALILDPTEHGEVNAIRNCVKMFTERGLSPAEIKLAWKDLSLYTVSIFWIF